MIPKINCSLKNAKAHTEDNLLIVSTGKISRSWAWSDTGFVTEKITDLDSGKSWEYSGTNCDWQLPDAKETAKAEIVSISAEISDDEGFTSQHIAVTSEIFYPDTGIVIQWNIWAYPNAPGIRTQLAVKTKKSISWGHSNQGSPQDARVERIPVSKPTSRRRFIGYYNETQQRNDTHQDILKEEIVDHPLHYKEWCNWASAACIEDDEGGIALVKESHKCVNQKGYATGGFICDEKHGLSCTGWGIRPSEISSTDFTPGWATWCLVWSGNDLDREVTFKTFDRLRYPIDPERDIYIQANTWGSTSSSQDARRAAGEKSVLKELEACAELGIDVLQIDDGWQVPPGNATWQPGDNGWHPHPESYPNGWKNVRTRAQELGIKIGLWAAAQPISLEELKANYNDGGFLQYKLDFASLKSRADIDELMQKVREFIKFTGHKVRVNWDVTENCPRYGYFFAREYGSIYLENRKPVQPLSVIYRPHTVLRDIWQVAKYLNLHRFQCSVQNIDRVDQDFSDAHLHTHAYSTAIALMGVPLFFQEIKYYSNEAKTEIKALLEVYKQNREAMFQGIVHPIGDKPDNASWTGLQCHLPEENKGFLMIFRERSNAKPKHSLKLGWVNSDQLEFTDLITDKKWQKNMPEDGSIEFSINETPGFLFLKYCSNS